MEPLRKDSSSSNSLTKSWLVKVGKSRRGKLQPLHPISDQEINLSSVLPNLLDFKFVPLRRGFSLKEPAEGSVFGINKAVLFPASASCSNEMEHGILAIYDEGQLRYWKYVDWQWTLLDARNLQYDDIVVFKGQVYVVDRRGTVSRIKSSLGVIRSSPPLYCCGGQKNLVESCGDLYIVDRDLNGERRTRQDYENVMDNMNPLGRFARFSMKRHPNTVKFRIYKLDEVLARWVEVKCVEDRVFVLCTDCSFSISCREYNGGKGNCIYFTEDDDYYEGCGLNAGSIRLFQLEDGRVRKLTDIPEFSQIFWPSNIGSSSA